MVYYFVKSCDLRKARNGKPYGCLEVCNKDGQTISANCWDLAASVRGWVIALSSELVPDSSGMYSFARSAIQSGLDTAGGDADLSKFPWVADLFPKIVSLEEFCGCVASLLSMDACIERKQFRDRVLELLPQVYASYRSAPAAKVMHHAYAGGLANHTYEMLRMLRAILPAFHPVNVALCTAGILYHDYGKLYEYDSNFDYTEVIALKPHPVFSAEIVWREFHDLLPMPEMDRLQHIIYSHHGRKDWGAPCEPATLEAFLVSQLDLLSGHSAAYVDGGYMERSTALGGRYIVK